MTFCLKCGKKLRQLGETGKQICTSCGSIYEDKGIIRESKTTPIRETENTYCQKCGSMLTSPTSYCPRCAIEYQSISPMPFKTNSVRTIGIIALIVIILIPVIGFSYFLKSQTPPLDIPAHTQTTSGTLTPSLTIHESQTSSKTSRRIEEPQAEDVSGYALYALDRFTEKYGAGKYQSINDEVYKTTAIFWFVYTEIKYVSDPQGYEYVQSPSETLRLRKGDCDDYALLMAAMCESVGLDAIVELVDTDQDKKINHALCSIYYTGAPEDFIEKQGKIWQEIGIYPEEYSIMYSSEPRLIFMRSDGDWDLGYKYGKGIWVTLENWDYCHSIYSLDVNHSDFTSSGSLQEIIDIITSGIEPLIGFKWNYFWSGRYNEQMVVEVTVTNYGGLTAKNVVVWTGLLASADKAYDQKTSNGFDLERGESKKVTLYLDVPRNVNTRVGVKVWGDNFNSLEDYEEYFQT